MADFESSVELEIAVDSGSLRDAREQIESELPDASLSAGGVRTDGGSAGSLRGGPIGDVSDDTGTLVDKADYRNRLLEDILDALQDGAGQGGGGGGNLLRKLGNLGGLLGGGLLGLAAGGAAKLGLPEIPKLKAPDIPPLSVPDIPALKIPDIPPLEVPFETPIPVENPLGSTGESGAPGGSGAGAPSPLLGILPGAAAGGSGSGSGSGGGFGLPSIEALAAGGAAASAGGLLAGAGGGLSAGSVASGLGSLGSSAGASIGPVAGTLTALGNGATMSRQDRRNNFSQLGLAGQASQVGGIPQLVNAGLPNGGVQRNSGPVSPSRERQARAQVNNTVQVDASGNQQRDREVERIVDQKLQQFKRDLERSLSL